MFISVCLTYFLLCVCADTWMWVSALSASYWSQARAVGLQTMLPATAVRVGANLSSWRGHSSQDLRMIPQTMYPQYQVASGSL